MRTVALVFTVSLVLWTCLIYAVYLLVGLVT